MRKFAVILLCFLSLFSLSSCHLVNSIIHDDEVVAKAGKNMLYKSEVEALIPRGMAGDDSLRLAMQYINAWASEMVFLDLAESKLSKTEKDVSKELESYRRSLLKYRYEQHYINERLDTAVTESEIKRYYDEHADSFVLTESIVRARYLRASPTSPNVQEIKELMSATDEDALWEAENLAYSSSEVFTGYSDNWVSISALAKDTGIDVVTLLSAGTEKFVQKDNENGTVSIVYIVEIMDVGLNAPVEYCAHEIEDIIISTRKRKLTASLEQDLLKSARDKGKFVIY